MLNLSSWIGSVNHLAHDNKYDVDNNDDVIIVVHGCAWLIRPFLSCAETIILSQGLLLICNKNITIE